MTVVISALAIAVSCLSIALSVKGSPSVQGAPMWAHARAELHGLLRRHSPRQMVNDHTFRQVACRCGFAVGAPRRVRRTDSYKRHGRCGIQ